MVRTALRASTDRYLVPLIFCAVEAHRTCLSVQFISVLSSCCVWSTVKVITFVLLAWPWLKKQHCLMRLFPSVQIARTVMQTLTHSSPRHEGKHLRGFQQAITIGVEVCKDFLHNRSTLSSALARPEPSPRALISSSRGELCLGASSSRFLRLRKTGFRRSVLKPHLDPSFRCPQKHRGAASSFPRHPDFSKPGKSHSRERE